MMCTGLKFFLAFLYWRIRCNLNDFKWLNAVCPQNVQAAVILCDSTILA